MGYNWLWRKELWLLLALLTSLLLVACGDTTTTIPAASSNTVTPALTANPTTTTGQNTAFQTKSPNQKITPQNFPPISQIKAISISDEWSGLSQISPAVAYYNLKSEGNEFTGRAEFSVGGHNYARQIKPITKTIELSISNQKMRTFVEALAVTPKSKGIYAPPTATDDFPNLRITIDTNAGEITFYSTASSDKRAPWQAIINDEMYIVSSDAPYLALKLLDPELGRDTFTKLKDEGRNAPNITP